MELFIDTEFTGSRLLQVAVVDSNDKVLYDSFVRPVDLTFDRQWAIVARIHGIYPRNVYKAPRHATVLQDILALCAGHTVIAYASGAEKSKLPGLADVSTVLCAAKAFRAREGLPRIVKLSAALDYYGIPWTFGQAHGALADARAARALWQWMESAPVKPKRRQSSPAREASFGRPAPVLQELQELLV